MNDDIKIGTGSLIIAGIGMKAIQKSAYINEFTATEKYYDDARDLLQLKSLKEQAQEYKKYLAYSYANNEMTLIPWNDSARRNDASKFTATVRRRWARPNFIHYPKFVNNLLKNVQPYSITYLKIPIQEDTNLKIVFKNVKHLSLQLERDIQKCIDKNPAYQFIKHGKYLRNMGAIMVSAGIIGMSYAAAALRTYFDKKTPSQ